MNRWLNRANQRISLVNAAVLLIGASLCGHVLGFVRTQLINANFPATGPNSTDAYFAAFKIPDLFFYTIAAGALGVAFMPFLADKLAKGDRKAVSELTSSLLNLLGLIMLGVGVVLVVFAEPLIRLVISNDLSPEQLDNAATIMRLVALNPFLFTLSGILTSVQQTFGRFFFYALAPIFYNLSIIVSIYLFRDSIGLKGLGIGALAGAILQLLIVFFGQTGLRFDYRPRINLRSFTFRRILRQLPARSVDQGIDSINSIYETNRARTLGEGYITFYENAYILHSVPIFLVGTTIATAAFPRLNMRLSQGRPDLFRLDFLRVLRAMIWIILPIVVVTYFARGYLARIIFKQGAPEIALILGFLVGAILFRVIYAIVSRYFYAHKDTKTPLYVSLFAIALNIYLAYTLSKPSSYGAAGLALAQSIVAAFEVFILMTIMVWRDKLLFSMQFWDGVWRILSITGFTIMITFIMVHIFPLELTDRGFITLSTKFAFIALPALGLHVFLSYLFGLEEARPIINKIRQIVLKPIRIQ